MPGNTGRFMQVAALPNEASSDHQELFADTDRHSEAQDTDRQSIAAAAQDSRRASDAVTFTSFP